MEGLIRWLAPQWALNRALARHRVDQVERLYKAAAPSNRRLAPRDWRSGDGVMDHARASLRQWARHLDENHDLTAAALTTLAAQAADLTIEPRVMAGKAPAERINEELRVEWAAWCDSGPIPWCQLAPLIARTWLRDGEVFVTHHMDGPGIGYRIAAHEPDLVPFDGEVDPPRLLHGIEIDAMGKPVAYHFYTAHPGDPHADVTTNTRRLPAMDVTHVKTVRRLNQRRGVSVLAPALERLADVDDYEESERMAAKIASSLCAAITRGADFAFDDTLNTSSGERPFELQPGMIFDSLRPGEKVDVLDTNRPNPELTNYRSSQLRAACAGIGVSYSTTTHDYAGTYSSQRQEMQEMVLAYARLRRVFVAALYRPVWRRFVNAAQLAGRVNLGGADQRTLFDFDFTGPAVPWIDPKKETDADVAAIGAGIESRQAIIRRRGGDPRRVTDELAADTFQSTPAPVPAAAKPPLQAVQ